MKTQQLQLLFGAKGAQLCERVFLFNRRFPKLFPDEMLGQLGAFLSHCCEPFLESRSILALSRILAAKYWVGKKAHRIASQRIHLKILQFDPTVYGVAIAVSALEEQEVFNENHIFRGIQSIIPGTKPIPDSYLSSQEGAIHFFYLEVKRVRGGLFTSAEKKKLQAELHLELLQGIQRISRSLFFPGNEEEIFKNIRHLSRELKYVNDLPQVMITFVEYSQETIKFLVIVLRIMKQGTPSIVSQSSHLPSVIHFSLENVLYLERLRKKYPKEAVIFTLETNSSLFLRNNHAVNLRAARRYIVKSLENLLGPFRDYNGGLLDQENQQLIKTKEALAKQGVYCTFLDDLFYGIKPIAMRPTISTQTTLELVSLFQKISNYHLASDQKYHIEYCTTEKEQLAIIKTREIQWKTSLPERLQARSYYIGSSCIEDDGHLYLCFFDRSPQKGLLFDALKRELRQSGALSPDQNRAVLRLNFQAGDPPSLNPRLAADIHSHILSNFLFEGLTRLTRAGTIEPAVAEKIDVSRSRTHYTFHLRPSWWSNGELVTAYHFERAWKKALMARSAGCLRADFFFPIKNARRAREKTAALSEVGIVVKNAKTLCIELEAPCAHFLNLLAMPLFFPLYGETEEPSVFNGPFALAEWKRNQSLSLSQNPFYWESSRVKLSGISIKMIRDPALSYDLFQKGELDLIGDPISPLTPDLLRKPRIKKQLRYKEISRVFWIHCNLRTFPLHNANLRRALSLALNRQRLIEKVFIDQIPQLSPLPPKYSHCHGRLEGSPESAEVYFKLALEELHIDRADFPELVVTHSDLSFETALFDELRMQWKETLGIKLAARPLPWSAFSSALEKGEFQLGGIFRRDLFNDPLFYLSFFRNSPSNSHGWENKEYEQLLNQLNREGKTEENFKKIEQLLIENAPVLPLINQRYLILINDRVKGLDWNENGCIDLKDVDIHETTLKTDPSPRSPLTGRLPNRTKAPAGEKAHH